MNPRTSDDELKGMAERLAYQVGAGRTPATISQEDRAILGT